LQSTQNSADSNSDWGVPANIDLPTTGDEAISRLHNCRSRDAYSILGLRHDCTDEDIKRHYRRQAVLVHPDKVGVFCSEFPLQAFAQNCTAGADEAFKILAAAFELISTPERRLAYNAQNLHRRDDVRQLHELMQMLSKRMEEVCLLSCRAASQ
jgi:DnaJ family protein C protein 14